MATPGHMRSNGLVLDAARAVIAALTDSQRTRLLAEMLREHADDLRRSNRARATVERPAKKPPRRAMTHLHVHGERITLCGIAVGPGIESRREAYGQDLERRGWPMCPTCMELDGTREAAPRITYAQAIARVLTDGARPMLTREIHAGVAKLRPDSSIASVAAELHRLRQTVPAPIKQCGENAHGLLYCLPGGDPRPD